MVTLKRAVRPLQTAALTRIQPSDSGCPGPPASPGPRLSKQRLHRLRRPEPGVSAVPGPSLRLAVPVSFNSVSDSRRCLGSSRSELRSRGGPSAFEPGRAPPPRRSARPATAHSRVPAAGPGIPAIRVRTGRARPAAKHPSSSDAPRRVPPVRLDRRAAGRCPGRHPSRSGRTGPRPGARRAGTAGRRSREQRARPGRTRLCPPPAAPPDPSTGGPAPRPPIRVAGGRRSPPPGDGTPCRRGREGGERDLRNWQKAANLYRSIVRG